MHPTMAEGFHIYQMYASLRNQLLSALSDADLAFTPGGENPTLGELCVEIGEVQQAYIDSFRTFTQDFTYRADQEGLATSVAELQAWYAQLEEDLEAALSALSAEDVENRVIDRGEDFKLPPRIQLEVFKEALLIFYGKVMVYLKAMGKPRPDIWNAWIG